MPEKAFLMIHDPAGLVMGTADDMRAMAVAQGFADRLVEPVRIAATFDIGRFRNAPPVLVDATAAEPEPDTDGAGPEATDKTEQLDDTEDDQAAGSEASQPLAGGQPPSSAPPDPAAIRAEAIGHVQSVVDLCRLAGQPQMAGRFLEQDMSLDEVRAALLAAKAEAEPEIAPHHPQPGRSSPARPGARSSPALSS